MQQLVDAARDQRKMFELLKPKQGDGKVIITASFDDKMHKIRLPKIERMDRLWEFFEAFFRVLKCDLFYQKEKKIQIFLKKEEFYSNSTSRKRRASSESSHSEAGQGQTNGTSSSKLKLKKAKRDPQTSSLGGKTDKVEKVERSPASDTKVAGTKPSSAKVSPSTSRVETPSTSPTRAPPPLAQLSPTKAQQQASSKKVPIYHNAHKIFRAQQTLRAQMSSSASPRSDTDSAGAATSSSPGPGVAATVTTAPPSLPRSVVTSLSVSHAPAPALAPAPPRLPPQTGARSLADVSQMSQHRAVFAPPSAPPTLPPQLAIISAPPPPLAAPSSAPPLLQPVVQKGNTDYNLMLTNRFSLYMSLEPSDPAEWNIEETISNISYLDPTLGPHVENFRSHEIDGKLLLLLTSGRDCYTYCI